MTNQKKVRSHDSKVDETLNFVALIYLLSSSFSKASSLTLLSPSWPLSLSFLINGIYRGWLALDPEACPGAFMKPWTPSCTRYPLLNVSSPLKWKEIALVHSRTFFCDKSPHVCNQAYCVALGWLGAPLIVVPFFNKCQAGSLVLRSGLFSDVKSTRLLVGCTRDCCWWSVRAPFCHTSCFCVFCRFWTNIPLGW